MYIEEIPQLHTSRQRSDVHLKIQRNVLPTVVKRLHRPANLIQPLLEILLLPQPEDVINIAMMQEEQRITRTVGRIARVTKHAADAEVPAAVNVGSVKCWDSFEFAGKAGIVWLREDFFDESSIGKSVQDGRNEVAAKTVTGGEVEHELLRHKGSVHYAAAACATGDVQWVLIGSGRDEGAIAAEAVVRIKDGGFIGPRRCGILWFGVERPVPVTALLVGMSSRC
jgi:hypothetical protein